MRIKAALAATAIWAASGCRSQPVEWGEPTSAPADSVAGMTVSADGSVNFVAPPRAPRLPLDSARCEEQSAFARDGSAWYATWYRRRTDESIVVVAARSLDAGVTWSKPGIVDSVDVGGSGCSRPGPSIAAGGGYVHIAYALQAPEGFGVFFAHSMDNAVTFHAPMTVIYGDRLSAVAIAADGMNVAVAYEDPSGTGHRVDLALSRTQGHTFEPRLRASPDEMSAVRPLVAIRDSVIAVSFADGTGNNRVVRVGHIH
jgi:hypothetical protein